MAVQKWTKAEKVSLSIKFRLFWRAGRSIFGFIFFIFAVSLIGYFVSADASERQFSLLVSQLSSVALIAAAFVVWLKYRRGLLAIATGRRLEACVLGVRVNSEGENGPNDYVLTWLDTDGFRGSSLPDTEISFQDIERGDRIFVYKNNDHDSWWERDIYGPPVRSTAGSSGR